MRRFTCLIDISEGETGMSVEKQLSQALEAANAQPDKFHEQIANFRDFERQLKLGGLEIERRKFSIPLMERLGVSYLNMK